MSTQSTRDTIESLRRLSRRFSSMNLAMAELVAQVLSMTEDPLHADTGPVTSAQLSRSIGILRTWHKQLNHTKRALRAVVKIAYDRGLNLGLDNATLANIGSLSLDTVQALEQMAVHESSENTDLPGYDPSTQQAFRVMVDLLTSSRAYLDEAKLRVFYVDTGGKVEWEFHNTLPLPRRDATDTK